jgi:hypothetical protein
LVHGVYNGIFYLISFGFQFYLAQYITKNNLIPSAIGHDCIKKLDLYEMVNFNNKIGLF